MRRDAILKSSDFAFFENVESAYRVEPITTHFQRSTEKIVKCIYSLVILLFYGES